MQPTYYIPTQRLTKILGIVIIAVTVICGLLVVLAFIGYGKLSVSVPANSIIKINGHPITGSPQHLRAGTYTVTVKSAMTEPYQTTVTIHNFLTTNLKPVLKQRDPSAIMSSLIGSYAGMGPPILSGAKFFDDNTWLVATVGPGSASQTALHYVNQRWTVAYFNGLDGYPRDATVLPGDVVAYLKEQAALYANR